MLNHKHDNPTFLYCQQEGSRRIQKALTIQNQHEQEKTYLTDCFAISFAKEKNKERRRESPDLQPNQTNHEREDWVRQGTMKESCPFCDWLFSIYRRAWWPGWLLGFDLPPLEESSVTVMQRQVRVHPSHFLFGSRSGLATVVAVWIPQKET